MIGNAALRPPSDLKNMAVRSSLQSFHVHDLDNVDVSSSQVGRNNSHTQHVEKSVSHRHLNNNSSSLQNKLIR